MSKSGKFCYIQQIIIHLSHLQWNSNNVKHPDHIYPNIRTPIILHSTVHLLLEKGWLITHQTEIALSCSLQFPDIPTEA